MASMRVVNKFFIWISKPTDEHALQLTCFDFPSAIPQQPLKRYDIALKKKIVQKQNKGVADFKEC